MKQGSLNLRIEELVLRGFAPGDRYDIAEALEQELARLFAESPTPELLTRSAELVQLNQAAIEIAPGAEPRMIGSQIAKAVFGELNK